ncbi:hypothetical protein Dsin_025808 [Dipteronia sinensis]|uniref:O-methyltransferase C-terminal domain-containing protein n=1 Tax=Dipteronia sinensis TaxID=43782 RepID=A0AAD9ZXY3_9ROSI|nr:hypothetical protein Dsin_025808 [Dipteronia sinensis]
MFFEGLDSVRAWILKLPTIENCLRLLKNCNRSIPDDEIVIVVEAILPVSPETNTTTKATSQIDVLMMTQSPGGKERRCQEFMALATGAGFSVEHIGGDMFESVPKGDAIFMKWILHDWSDEHCLRLLKNCYKSIPEDGKLIVVETILPDFPEANTATKAAFQIDVLMMTQNPGGKERSRQEYMALATGAGFSGIRFETSACNSWVMEFYK